MKYRLLILFFLIIFLFYLYLSFLNPEKVKMDMGFGWVFEASTATYTLFSFLLGILVSVIIGLLSDLGRILSTWKKRREEKRKREIDSFLEKARLYESKGEKERALESLNRAIKKDPLYLEPYISLAKLHLRFRDFEKAVEVMNLAEMNVGKKEEILDLRASILLEKGDLRDAEKDLREIVRLNGSNINALGKLRDIYVREKRWEEAIAIQERLVKQVKDAAEEKKLIGLRFEKAKDAFEREEESYEKLLEETKDLLREDKRFVPAYILLGNIYEKLGKQNEAGRVYGRGYNRTGHVIFLRKMEDLYIGRGDPGVILKIYRRILEVSPKDKLISFLYALLCLRLEMIQEATDTLNQLHYEGVNFPGLFRAMAEVHVHKGELRRAIEYFRKACPFDEGYIPFICHNCGAPKETWGPFCDNCLSWNTINVKREEFSFDESEEFKKLYLEERGDESY